MEWKNVQVRHRAFGEGSVEKNENGYMTVLFGGEEKEFSYPAVFRFFMTVEDEQAKNCVEEALKEMDAAQEREKLMRLAKLTQLRKDAAEEKTTARTRKTAGKKETKKKET